MPSYPHTGVTVGKTARLDQILFTPSGTLFTSGDAYSFGYAENRLLTIEPVVIPDFAKQEKQYAWLAKIQHDSFQATWDALYAAYRFTKGFVNARVREDVTQDSYYFVEDPTPETPTKTTSLGVKFIYKHTMDKAILSILAQGRLSQDQYDVINTVTTGDTGGTSIGGLTGSGYAETSFVPGGFQSMSIDNGDGTGFVGSLLNFDFQLESMAEDDHDDRDRYIHNKFKYTLTGRAKNVEPLEQKAWNKTGRVLSTIVVKDKTGRPITINQARAGATFTLADNKRDAAFKFTGEVSQNRNEASPNAININRTSAGLILSTTGLN